MRAQRRRATVRDSGKRGATTQALRRARSSQGTIGLLHLSVKPFYVNITPRDEIEHTRRNKGKHTRTQRRTANQQRECSDLVPDRIKFFSVSSVVNYSFYSAQAATINFQSALVQSQSIS